MFAKRTTNFKSRGVVVKRLCLWWFFVRNFHSFDLGLFLTGLKRGEFRENLCVSVIFGSYQIIPWPFWVEPQHRCFARRATSFVTFNRIFHSWPWKKYLKQYLECQFSSHFGFFCIPKMSFSKTKFDWLKPKKAFWD